MLRAPLLSLLVLLAPFAAAAPAEQVVTGTLLVGTGFLTLNDASVFLIGTNPAPGVDGVYVPLAARALGGEPVTLTWTSDVGGRLALRFYDAWHLVGSCTLPALPVTEGRLDCVAPAGADHVGVELMLGAAADFTLRYTYEA